jgi:hypothetical protein
MFDQLSSNMMNIVETRAAAATGEMVEKSKQLMDLLRNLQTAAFPVQTEKCFNSRKEYPTVPFDIEWVHIFHIRPFEAAWRNSFGLPEHTYLENLMEHSILNQIRTRNFDVIRYAARLMAPGDLDTYDEGYVYGQMNVAKAVVNSAIRMGSEPSTRRTLEVSSVA